MAISVRKRLNIFLRDFFKCKNCSKSPATHPEIILHIDHIHPVSKGVKDSIENLQTLCNICNCTKSNLTMDDIEERIIKKKLNIRPIHYPKQTAKDRDDRLKNGQCIIHGSFLSNKYSKNKSIYYCGHIGCSIYLISNEQGEFNLPEVFDHLMIGKFSFIPQYCPSN